MNRRVIAETDLACHTASLLALNSGMKVRVEYPRRQALGTAIAFAVFSPVPLMVGLVPGPIVGGYTGIFLGTESRPVAFSGAVLGIVVVIAVMTFIPSLLALWITRRIKGGTGDRNV
jgi:cobalamin synthase